MPDNGVENGAMRWILLGCVGIAIVVGISLAPPRNPVPASHVPMDTFTIKSSVFKEGGAIPAKFTCDGDDVNPFLEIKNTPEGTVSFALVVDDPDAPRGTWIHWLVWNIDPKTQYISEDNLPSDAVQGKTSAGYVKYSGPCPPRGDKPHRYVFSLYALDTMLTVPAGADNAALLAAMEGHIINQTALTGLYQRP
ncbi:MAG: YbhB/YbcL family Raf kinase inhibitor-like protein [Candidatus Jorgensenbacteria bacterium]